ncbi:hypothetical protein BD779DRAFT_1670395 [Infundibulicybe gibba]|nr:hypothetical protein BD779DRAFT_1670395 [Infundibulicybe gibba]
MPMSSIPDTTTRHDLITIRKYIGTNQDVQAQLDEINSTKLTIQHTIQAIQTLIGQAHHAQSELRGQLGSLLVRYPRDLSKRRAATHQLLSATIEASLIKLSLIRAQTSSFLYNTPGSNRALKAMHAQLELEAREMDEEGNRLDRQIEEYETLLGLVDGGRENGFAQVVDDWTRVQKETDECKRDLRRLGWTGD